MAYSRRTVRDYETIMNKDLYDNLQDGIDESKEAITEVNTQITNISEQVEEISGEIGGVKFTYDEEDKYLVFGMDEDGGSDDGGDDETDDDNIITPAEAAEIFDNAEKNSGN